MPNRLALYATGLILVYGPQQGALAQNAGTPDEVLASEEAPDEALSGEQLLEIAQMTNALRDLESRAAALGLAMGASAGEEDLETRCPTTTDPAQFGCDLSSERCVSEAVEESLEKVSRINTVNADQSLWSRSGTSRGFARHFRIKLVKVLRFLSVAAERRRVGRGELSRYTVSSESAESCLLALAEPDAASLVSAAAAPDLRRGTKRYLLGVTRLVSSIYGELGRRTGSGSCEGNVGCRLNRAVAAAVQRGRPRPGLPDASLGLGRNPHVDELARQLSPAGMEIPGAAALEPDLQEETLP